MAIVDLLFDYAIFDVYSNKCLDIFIAVCGLGNAYISLMNIENEEK